MAKRKSKKRSKGYLLPKYQEAIVPKNLKTIDSFYDNPAAMGSYLSYPYRTLQNPSYRDIRINPPQYHDPNTIRELHLEKRLRPTNITPEMMQTGGKVDLPKYQDEGEVKKIPISPEEYYNLKQSVMDSAALSRYTENFYDTFYREADRRDSISFPSYSTEKLTPGKNWRDGKWISDWEKNANKLLEGKTHIKPIEHKIAHFKRGDYKDFLKAQEEWTPGNPDNPIKAKRYFEYEDPKDIKYKIPIYKSPTTNLRQYEIDYPWYQDVGEWVRENTPKTQFQIPEWAQKLGNTVNENADKIGDKIYESTADIVWDLTRNDLANVLDGWIYKDGEWIQMPWAKEYKEDLEYEPIKEIETISKESPNIEEQKSNETIKESTQKTTTKNIEEISGKVVNKDTGESWTKEEWEALKGKGSFGEARKKAKKEYGGPISKYQGGDDVTPSLEDRGMSYMGVSKEDLNKTEQDIHNALAEKDWSNFSNYWKDIPKEEQEAIKEEYNTVHKGDKPVEVKYPNWSKLSDTEKFGLYEAQERYRDKLTHSLYMFDLARKKGKAFSMAAGIGHEGQNLLDGIGQSIKSGTLQNIYGTSADSGTDMRSNILGINAASTDISREDFINSLFEEGVYKYTGTPNVNKRTFEDLQEDWFGEKERTGKLTKQENGGPIPKYQDKGEVETLPSHLLPRQAYKESTFRDSAKSAAGALGLTQFLPATFEELKEDGKLPADADIYNIENSIQAQQEYVQELYNRPWNTKENPTEEVRIAKTLGAYNYGPNNLVEFLNAQKRKGIDIYKTLDWVPNLPKETRDYIEYITGTADSEKYTTWDSDYQKALKNPAYKRIIDAYGTQAFENTSSSKGVFAPDYMPDYKPSPLQVPYDFMNPDTLSREGIRDLQSELLKENYFLGTSGKNKDGVDGEMGLRTKAAYEDMLRQEHGIEIDEDGEVSLFESAMDQLSNFFFSDDEIEPENLPRIITNKGDTLRGEEFDAFIGKPGAYERALKEKTTKKEHGAEVDSVISMLEDMYGTHDNLPKYQDGLEVKNTTVDLGPVVYDTFEDAATPKMMAALDKIPITSDGFNKVKGDKVILPGEGEEIPVTTEQMTEPIKVTGSDGKSKILEPGVVEEFKTPVLEEKLSPLDAFLKAKEEYGGLKTIKPSDKKSTSKSKNTSRKPVKMDSFGNVY
jgi:hypothetical protein